MSVKDISVAAHGCASAADREWFEHNPGRRFRMRAETLSERSASPWYALTGPDLPDPSRRVLVASVPDIGVRLRLSVAPSLRVPPGDPGDDVLSRVFLAIAPPSLAHLYTATMKGNWS